MTPPQNSLTHDPAPPQSGVNEAGLREQFIEEQRVRARALTNLFGMFGDKYNTLQAACIADPTCTLELAREKLLTQMGKDSTPSNKSAAPHIYAGNGNFTGDGIRQAIMARAGYEPIQPDNPTGYGTG